MTLSIGDRLGPYEILAPIGAGGMGEVYRAHDTRLRRDVAIKVSAARFSERFEREAKAIAALNHSNICQVYDVGPNYLVMEYIEGESPKGPLPLEEALRIARQIGDALGAAHDKGITHRDLKPGNIKIKPDGTVKVLDFGLAKVTAAPAVSGENSPTLTMGMTQVGMILGTAAYMAPEQARGKENVDKRADIWAFGVVLYELLTGKRLFTGEDVTEILASVVKEQPDLQRAPVKVRRLLRKCLEKDPKKRLRDIGDVWELLDVGQVSDLPSQGGALRHWVAWGVAGVFAAALAALAWVHFREVPARPAEVRFQVPFPRAAGINDGFRLSPNGRLIAFTATTEGARRIHVRPLDSLEARALPGTENPSDLFWSPDSENIGFFADGKLKRVGLGGKLPQTLAPSADHRGGAWSPSGVILFASGPSGPLYRIPDTGGTPVAATKIPPEGEGHRYPEILPDGQHFLFFRATDAPEAVGAYVGSLDGMQPVRVLPDSSNVAYVPAETGKGGYIFFRREGSLMAQPFDPTGLRTSGGVLSVADQIANGFNNILWGDFATVPGVLAYVSGIAAQNSEDLVWVDRAGKRSSLLQAVNGRHELSLDGTKVAFFRYDPRSASSDPDLWVQDLTRGGTVRLTLSGAFNAIWSPDGKRIAYASRTLARTDFYLIPATGAAKPELLLGSAGQNARLYDWSLDGKWIVYLNIGVAPGDLSLLPVEGDHKPVTYLPKTSFRRQNAQFSPDGLWMAYESDESGKFEVYVQAVPASSEKVTISAGGGAIPRWRRDGKELYYVTPDLKLMGVAVKTGTKFEAGVPRQILENFGGTVYASSADGQRFLVAQQRAEGAVPPITVVLNWQAGLKK